MSESTKDQTNETYDPYKGTVELVARDWFKGGTHHGGDLIETLPSIDPAIRGNQDIVLVSEQDLMGERIVRMAADVPEKK